MTVELSHPVQEQLGRLAVERGCSIEVIVELAIQRYLEAASITNLNDGDISATQMKLLEEFSDWPAWEEVTGGTPDEAR